jgi:BirA family biotin operon repressor/biotin-[acetyl-CoA-carboxylase] ligase
MLNGNEGFRRMLRRGSVMTDPLYRLLAERPGNVVSGEQIAERLGVSRAAVWKRIRALRGVGYVIEGTRGVGYRLTGRPDRIDAGELRGLLLPGGPWREIVVLDATDSTNSRAMEMAENGAPHGTLVFADSQSGGRGRLGRHWLSPPGKNLYVSLLLRPDIPVAAVPRLSLVAGVALADMAEELGVPGWLKWPNDLYIGERKAAGILSEMASDLDRVRHVTVGVGINVNMEEADFPADLRDRATSLRMHSDRPFRRVEVLARFLDAFGGRYQEFLAGGFAALRPGWERRDFLRGRRVRVRSGETSVWGEACGVDEGGALLFRRDGAPAPEPLQSGELVEFEP